MCQHLPRIAPLSHGFGRITNEIEPYSPNLPRLTFLVRVPPRATSVGSRVSHPLLRMMTPLSLQRF